MFYKNSNYLQFGFTKLSLLLLFSLIYIDFVTSFNLTQFVFQGAEARVDQGPINFLIEFIHPINVTKAVNGHRYIVPNPNNVTRVDVSYTGLLAGKRYRYAIYQNPVIGDCSTTGQIWNPTGSTLNTCEPSTPWKCIFGDLSGKQSLLIGHGDGLGGMPSYKDANLILNMDRYGIINRSVVILDGVNIAACATIKANA